MAVVPSIAAATIPTGIVLLSVDDPGAVRRSVVAVTRPDRSPGASALVQTLREQGALHA